MPRLGKRYVEHLNVRVPTPEMDTLRQYCEEMHRTQSDVIREFIRSLKQAVTATQENPKEVERAVEEIN